jgi:hypothetical protein
MRLPNLAAIDEFLDTASKHVAAGAAMFNCEEKRRHDEAAADNIQHARRALREEALKLCDTRRP